MAGRFKPYDRKRNLTMKGYRTILAATAIFTAMVLCQQNAGAQQIAVKANALNLVLMTPDFGAELVTGEKTSAALSISGHFRPYGIDSRLLAVKPHFRYWFSGRPLNREYVGLSALITVYDSNLRDIRYKGVAGGPVLTGGYVLSLGSRVALEFSAGLGSVWFSRRTYSHDYDTEDFRERDWSNSKGFKLFPTNLGISFIYIVR